MKNPIFEANPSLDCYYETQDGSCFFTENAAQGHAKTLKDKKVSIVHKANEIEVEAEVLEPVAPIEPATPTVPVVEPEKVEPKVVPMEAKPNTKK